MPNSKRHLTTRLRALSWGQRLYAMIVLLAIGVFGYTGINHCRARSYQAFHEQITAAGGAAKRNLYMSSDAEEVYFSALQGDFSFLAIHSVSGSGADCSIDGNILRRMRSFPEITSLQLNDISLLPEDYQKIYSLTNLTRLNLAFNDLTDADLEGIEQLENLEFLDLRYTLITDKSIPRITNLTGLSTLDLTGTNISPAGAERLRQAFQQIQGTAQQAKINHRQSPSAAFRQAVILLQPTACYGPNTRGSGEMRLILRKESWKGRQNDIPAIAQLIDVESATIQRFDLSPALLEALAALPRLTQVNISDSPLQVADLSILQKSKSIRSLRLNAVMVDETAISSLSGIKSLESLSIFNSRLTPGACRDLADLSALSALSLRQVIVEPESLANMISSLEGATNLRHLDLAGVPLDDDSVPTLAGLRQLVSLGVGVTRISDASVPELSACTHLQQLDVASTEMTPAGIAKLEAAMLPTKARVVHPKSKTATFQLDLAQLAEKAKTDAIGEKQ